MDLDINKKISAVILDESRPVVERMYAVELSAMISEAMASDDPLFYNSLKVLKAEANLLSEGRLEVFLGPHPNDPDAHVWRVSCINCAQEPLEQEEIEEDDGA